MTNGDKKNGTPVSGAFPWMTVAKAPDRPAEAIYIPPTAPAPVSKPSAPTPVSAPSAPSYAAPSPPAPTVDTSQIIYPVEKQIIIQAQMEKGLSEKEAERYFQDISESPAAVKEEVKKATEPVTITYVSGEEATFLPTAPEVKLERGEITTKEYIQLTGKIPEREVDTGQIYGMYGVPTRAEVAEMEKAKPSLAPSEYETYWEAEIGGVKKQFPTKAAAEEAQYAYMTAGKPLVSGYVPIAGEKVAAEFYKTPEGGIVITRFVGITPEKEAKYTEWISRQAVSVKPSEPMKFEDYIYAPSKEEMITLGKKEPMLIAKEVSYQWGFPLQKITEVPVSALALEKQKEIAPTIRELGVQMANQAAIQATEFAKTMGITTPEKAKGYEVYKGRQEAAEMVTKPISEALIGMEQWAMQYKPALTAAKIPIGFIPGTYEKKEVEAFYGTAIQIPRHIIAFGEDILKAGSAISYRIGAIAPGAYVPPLIRTVPITKWEKEKEAYQIKIAGQYPTFAEAPIGTAIGVAGEFIAFQMTFAGIEGIAARFEPKPISMVWKEIRPIPGAFETTPAGIISKAQTDALIVTSDARTSVTSNIRGVLKEIQLGKPTFIVAGKEPVKVSAVGVEVYKMKVFEGLEYTGWQKTITSDLGKIPPYVSERGITLGGEYAIHISKGGILETGITSEGVAISRKLLETPQYEAFTVLTKEGAKGMVKVFKPTEAAEGAIEIISPGKERIVPFAKTFGVAIPKEALIISEKQLAIGIGKQIGKISMIGVVGAVKTQIPQINIVKMAQLTKISQLPLTKALEKAIPVYAERQIPITRQIISPISVAKEISIIKPVQIPITKQIQMPIFRQIGIQIPIGKQVQIPITKQVTTPITKEAMISIGRITTPTPIGITQPPPPKQIIFPPPFLPFDLGGIAGKRKKRKTAAQIQFTKYQPSLVAEFMGIKGIKPTRITGIEVRPILSMSSIFKTSKKRGRKKRGKKK